MLDYKFKNKSLRSNIIYLSKLAQFIELIEEGSIVVEVDNKRYADFLAHYQNVWDHIEKISPKSIERFIKNHNIAQ